MRRLLAIPAAVAVILAASLPLSAPAQAAVDPDWPWQMVFPVDGPHQSNYGNYGAPRYHGSHEGNDIMAAKGTPVVAVGGGVVSTWITPVNEDSDYPSVYLGIDHGNGWFTRYIHLNNDTIPGDGTDPDDGKVRGIAPGIEAGTEVEAGQLIGWVGDSGNAEETGPHLHFELRWNGGNGGHGEDVDPYEYLVNAEHNWNGEFKDDDNSVHEANIDRIFQAGITVGCNPPAYNEYCPHDSITRGQMAAFIARALGLSETSGGTDFDDMSGHLFENAVDKIMTAEIGFGCDKVDSYCPDQPLLRDEMAQLLVNAFGYDNPEDTDFFADDDGNPFEDAINKIRYHDITVGCDTDEASLYCPNEAITRAQMATFFVRTGAA